MKTKTKVKVTLRWCESNEFALSFPVNGAPIDDPLNAETKTARKDTTSFKLLAWIFGGYTVILIAFGSLACLGIAYVCVRPKA